MFPRKRLRNRPILAGGRPTIAAALYFLLIVSVPVLASQDNQVPMGHYLSFDRERNLQTGMASLVEDPQTAQSSHELGIARDLDSALRTPGLKGLWMEFKWRSLEIGDGQYDWSVLDADMAVARRYGLEFIVKVADRSFNGGLVMPDYFPHEYVLETSGNGHSGSTSKRWDPYVYNRLIRLYQAIAERYADEPAFGGIATTETATGDFPDGGYTLDAYREALIQIVTQTEAALERGKLFLYLNFLKGGDSSDMNEDARVALLQAVPHKNLVVGAPDITPDVKGMPRSVTPYRIHVRKTMPDLPQFCHLQNVDQGFRGINVKTNQYREDYRDEIARVREREQQSWFHGVPAVFEFDDLRDAQGDQVEMHPATEVGKLWTPSELFDYGKRNFDCSYFMWHYREYPAAGEFTWSDVRQVISGNQCFFEPGGCAAAARNDFPRAPDLF